MHSPEAREVESTTIKDVIHLILDVCTLVVNCLLLGCNLLLEVLDVILKLPSIDLVRDFLGCLLDIIVNVRVGIDNVLHNVAANFIS